MAHEALIRRALRYAGTGLDRAGVQRKDDAWVELQFDAGEARLLPVWRYRNLVSGVDLPQRQARAVYVEHPAVAPALAAANHVVLLGLDEHEHPVLAVDLSSLEEADALSLTGGESFADLRVVGPFLDAQDAARCAYARGMMYWHRNYRHCTRCGSPTESRQGGHLRVCTNSDCAHPLFPRTDPAVIMLVVNEGTGDQPPRCLLGRDAGWPKGTYSTLAGFVEPGETLEEAVAREVFEEAGIHVRDVTYMASQPWPFPSSIMLGFRAMADTTELVIDPDEIEDARWFTAAEIRTFGEWGDQHSSLQVPRRDSIARFLIDSWVDEQN